MGLPPWRGLHSVISSDGLPSALWLCVVKENVLEQNLKYPNQSCFLVEGHCVDSPGHYVPRPLTHPSLFHAWVNDWLVRVRFAGDMFISGLMFGGGDFHCGRSTTYSCAP